MKWICEWCEPSEEPASLPMKHPEKCKILNCPKHGRTWHYCKEEKGNDSLSDYRGKEGHSQRGPSR